MGVKRIRLREGVFEIGRRSQEKGAIIRTKKEGLNASWEREECSPLNR